ncbi:MAG: T9SS type A sorting domain-containing protein [Bacteroidetes bacterium]|nr:T9SS type A sorting domain-containing protein [Bacteroidota bacterium]
MFRKGNGLYVTHYTQGLRLLDISDPENLVEVGYYDNYEDYLSDTCNDLYFFIRSIIEGGNVSNWFQHIFGVFPDQNRPDICYAGGSDGFYIFDVLPIAAPTGFTLSGSVGEHPTLSWDASSAVGLTGYKLYQKWGSGGSYSLLITLGRNTTSFTDPGVTIGPGGKYETRTCYRVTAYNIIDRESAPSGQKCVSFDEVQKSGGPTEAAVVSYVFNLLTAYPNPFNPSTQISYSLAQDADVTLKVYDMLGTEVSELLNETQPAGIYEINFNGKNLASGVYIYRVIARKNGSVLFTDTKRMILLR